MDFVLLETFNDVWEAGMVKSLLESEGITAFVEGETIAAVAPYLGTWQRGVRLLVPEEQFEQARESLTQWRGSKALSDADDPGGSGNAGAPAE